MEKIELPFSSYKVGRKKKNKSLGYPQIAGEEKKKCSSIKQ